jgi:hypothetical protein
MSYIIGLRCWLHPNTVSNQVLGSQYADIIGLASSSSSCRFHRVVLGTGEGKTIGRNASGDTFESMEGWYHPVEAGMRR